MWLQSDMNETFRLVCLRRTLSKLNEYHRCVSFMRARRYILTKDCEVSYLS